ncbi:UNVERIFIED_CONTAM: hypothetical protein FKN15_008210 [Acipenser sinensis]
MMRGRGGAPRLALRRGLRQRGGMMGRGAALMGRGAGGLGRGGLGGRAEVGCEPVTPRTANKLLNHRAREPGLSAVVV